MNRWGGKLGVSFDCLVKKPLYWRIFSSTTHTHTHPHTMLRSSSSWLAPMQTPTPPCPTMTLRGVEPPFTKPGASSMGHCGTVLLVVRNQTFQTVEGTGDCGWVESVRSSLQSPKPMSVADGQVAPSPNMGVNDSVSQRLELSEVQSTVSTFSFFYPFHCLWATHYPHVFPCRYVRLQLPAHKLSGDHGRARMWQIPIRGRALPRMEKE